MAENEKIVVKLKEQMEEALKEFHYARIEIETIAETVITDIRDNMKLYVLNNIRRVIRKSPDELVELTDEQFAKMTEEVEQAVAAEIGEIVQGLRDFRGWNDNDTVYITSGTYAWKVIKKIEVPVNKILKKYKIGSIELKNWTWLSLETNELISNRFVESKKKYLDKKKSYKYAEMRYREESRIDNVLEKLPGGEKS